MVQILNKKPKIGDRIGEYTVTEVRGKRVFATTGKLTAIELKTLRAHFALPAAQRSGFCFRPGSHVFTTNSYSS